MGGGQIPPPLSHFNVAPKLNKNFALMNLGLELNLITYIYRKFEVSRIAESDVIFAFVRDTLGVSHMWRVKRSALRSRLTGSVVQPMSYFDRLS